MWNLPSSKYVKEFEPKLNSYNNNSNNNNSMMMLKKERSYTEDTQDSSRCEDQDEQPDIIPVSSLASISDSSTMSSTLSPGASISSPSPPLPVRSIFKSYWSSPHHHRDGGGGYHGSVVVDDTKKKSKEDEVELLHKLALPFVDEGDSSSSSLPSSSSSGNITKATTTLRKSSSAQAAPIKTTPLPTVTQSRRSSIDDTTIDYSMKNKSRIPITPRRQILPSVAAPPPSPLHAAAAETASTLSSVQDQARFNCTSTPLRGGTSRTWSSTTSLIKRPTHSCLRPSRYSCSIIDERRLSSLHQELNNDEKTATKDEDGCSSEEGNEEEASAIKSRSQMKRSKSVSFYSEVSVFEFFVCNKLFDNPHGCSSEGWSKYFTA